MFELPEHIDRESSISRQLVRDAVRNTDPRLVFCGPWHPNKVQQLPYTRTTAHVLHKEFFAGNVVVLDPASLTVERYEVKTREQRRRSK